MSSASSSTINVENPSIYVRFIGASKINAFKLELKNKETIESSLDLMKDKGFNIKDIYTCYLERIDTKTISKSTTLMNYVSPFYIDVKTPILIQSDEEKNQEYVLFPLNPRYSSNVSSDNLSYKISKADLNTETKSGLPIITLIITGLSE